ncbi:glycosyltransferase [Polynucleobacter hallstattensis]|uniref:glycosyltransferase n=1 Tax=Polynucleobacter hallstattensis TaxID=1855586 RepID=UPI001C0D8919|nr:glycosyltransferase [Polynucleobacter hallstattensis]MBU3560604.1 glycosyltransferase [Polynucleobacter hallstattensis]
MHQNNKIRTYLQKLLRVARKYPILQKLLRVARKYPILQKLLRGVHKYPVVVFYSLINYRLRKDLEYFFDKSWYKARYADINNSKLNPIDHYIKFGAKEGRWPNPFFDSGWYLKAYSDVDISGLNPLLHYVKYGISEERPLSNKFFSDQFLIKFPLQGIARRIKGKSKLNKGEIKNELSRIPTSSKPLVSIIIPVYGKLEYTIQCLISISVYPPKIPFEIIIIDDCSPDDTPNLFKDIENLVFTRNKVNLGFIGSCNLGAKIAKGEFLCFLNNDTEVMPGWLEELILTFKNIPKAGFVGSKLLYPDWSLQEAGGIVWADGRAWNYGRNQDANEPKYCYARDVDYCSGASIAVPTKLFNMLGGFDAHFSPAYYEDCDLAFQIRNLGLRTIYQPLSMLIHHEGITSGVDIQQGVKAYQLKNQEKFYRKWSKALLENGAYGINVDNAKDRQFKNHILIIDHCIPTPDQDAGSLLAFNMMLLLKEMEFRITFIPEDNLLFNTIYTPMLQRLGIEVLYKPYVKSVKTYLKEMGDIHDVVMLIRPQVAQNYISAVRLWAPKASILFHTIDLHHVRMMREAMLENSPGKKALAAEMKKMELKIVEEVDLTISVSEVESEILRKEVPGAEVQTLPLIIEAVGTKKIFSERRDIIFTGGFQHMPNIDAVKFFVRDVMPIIRDKLPGVRLLVVGSNTPAEIYDLACDDVIIKGYVENLNVILDSARVSIAPLRFGAGVKGKIASSMAAGLPVVASLLATEGMELAHLDNCLIAENPQEYAEYIRLLYEDEILWAKISDAGLIFAEKSWGSSASARKLLEILKKIDINLSYEVKERVPLYTSLHHSYEYSLGK